MYTLVNIYKIIIMELNTESPEYWESLLSEEWLGLFEDEITTNTKVSSILDSVDSLESLQNHINKYLNDNNFSIDIDYINWEIKLYDEELLIWEIKPTNYSEWSIESDSHLYKLVDEDYRWKWIGTFLMNVYSKLDDLKESAFSLPNTEHSSDKLMLQFLINHWYTIIWKYVDWCFEESSDDINYYIFDEATPSDLPFICKLELNKKIS